MKYNPITAWLIEVAQRRERVALYTGPIGEPPEYLFDDPMQQEIYTTMKYHPITAWLEEVARRHDSVSLYEGEPGTPPDDDIDLPKAPGAVVSQALWRGEMGDAELFATLYRDRAIFDTSTRLWVLFRDHRWQDDQAGAVRRLIAGPVAASYLSLAGEIQHSLATETDKERADKKRAMVEQALHRAGALRSRSRIDNVLNLAQALPGMSTDGAAWDATPWLLPVANGVIDLKTGTLRSGTPGDKVRTVAPTAFQGLDVPAPRFEQFLREIFEDKPEREAIISFLNRLFGAAISGTAREHILPIFCGERGRNGKDTLFKAIERVLGPLVGPVSTDVLIDGGRGRSAGSATPHLMDLRGRRLVWASETSEGARLHAAQVKYVTGGGTITGRPLYGKPVTWRPTHLLCLLTNPKPHAPADDDALWARVKLIDFAMRFVDAPTGPNERPCDPQLSDALEQEAPGILAWLVRGCLAWQREGLNPPDCVRLATQEYQGEEDTISQFFDDCCVLADHTMVKASTLYQAYKSWSEDQGNKPMSGAAFGKRMTQRDFDRVRHDDGNYYLGIGLLRL